MRKRFRSIRSAPLICTLRSPFTAIAVTLLGIACVSCALAGEPTKGHAETNSTTFLSGRDLPVFYVQIFGNDFPIPVRFEYMPDYHPRGAWIYLQSPSPALIEELGPEMLAPSLTASIEVGSYPTYTKALATNPQTGAYSVKRFACFGLSIEIHQYTAGKAAQLHEISVLIHDNNEYLSYVGDSDNLPKALLRFYGALNNVPIGKCDWITKGREKSGRD